MSYFSNLFAPKISEECRRRIVFMAEVDLQSNPADPELCMTNIVAVGAEYSRREGLKLVDTCLLRDAIKICVSTGFSVSENFQVTVVDLFDGLDFLNIPQMQKFLDMPVDMVVACQIYNPPHYGFGAGRNRNSACATSRHHFDDAAWHDAAATTGAKLIMVGTDGFTTIGGRRFCGPSYAYSHADDSCCERVEVLLRQDIARHLPKKSVAELQLK
jgi:hypothetical protein